jgi:hypothetical protein
VIQHTHHDSLLDLNVLDEVSLQIRSKYILLLESIMSGLPCNPNGTLDYSFHQDVLISTVESRDSTIIEAVLCARISPPIAVQSERSSPQSFRMFRTTQLVDIRCIGSNPSLLVPPSCNHRLKGKQLLEQFDAACSGR